MFELANDLLRRGHTVKVVTTIPSHNLPDGVGAEPFPVVCCEGGVQVLRVSTMNNHQVGYVRRGLAELLMPLRFYQAIKKHGFHEVDHVLVYSPPLLLALVGVWLKNHSRHFLLNVQDLFPQNAIDLGILKNRVVIQMFRWLERWLYRKADLILLHSLGNQAQLQSQFPDLPSHKFKVMHNWVSIEQYLNHQKNDFRRQYGLAGKFVVLFAGVMGPSQALDKVLDLADRVREINEMVFLLVGDGSERNKLMAKAKAMSLRNVHFESFVSKDDYPDLVRACDVGLLSLSPKNTTPVVPGKLLGYMASKKPTLAFLQEASDGHQMIREAACGFSTLSSDPEAMYVALMQCYEERDRLEEIGQRGFDYLMQHYTVERCVDALDGMIKEMA